MMQGAGRGRGSFLANVPALRRLLLMRLACRALPRVVLIAFPCPLAAVAVLLAAGGGGSAALHTGGLALGQGGGVGQGCVAC